MSSVECHHEGNFTARVNVVRLIDRPGRFAVDLTVTCDDCLQPLRFLGLPGGVSFDHPTCDPFAIEARLPAELA